MADTNDPILTGSPDRYSKIDVGTTESQIALIEDPIIVIGLIIANKTVNNVRTVIYYVPTDGQKTVRWGPRVIPPGESLEISAGSRDVLLPGDEIRARGDTDYALDFWVSFVK